jgi:methenyltetrahydrofolate cyclohydrolase
MKLMATLVQLSIEEFHRKLSSNSPGPGGGSVAALSGALAAGLISKVCNLSIGKPGYEAFHDRLTDVLQKAEFLSKSLLERVDLDPQAFGEVMAALKMPEEPEAVGKARNEAKQRGYKSAVESALGIAHECVDVLGLAEALLGKSNANALSELAVASLQAYAGLEGAIMSLKMNFPALKDEKFVARAALEGTTLLKKGLEIKNGARKYVMGNIAA